MNPTETAAAPTSKVKRDANGRVTEQYDVPLNINAHHIKREHRGLEPHFLDRVSLNAVWWAGVGMCVFGGAAYLM